MGRYIYINMIKALVTRKGKRKKEKVKGKGGRKRKHKERKRESKKRHERGGKALKGKIIKV